jgi:hypothetical protein
MFCPDCGARNADNAKFCSGCGNALGVSAQKMQAPSQPSPQPYSAPLQPGQKNPTLAAILNFFLPGIGYWYWGYRKVVGVPPVLLFIGVIILDYILWNFLFYAGFITLAIDGFFAYDLYLKTTGQRGWVEATM